MKKCMQKCEYNTDEGCMASKLGATCNLSNTEGKTENEAMPVNKEFVKLVKNALLDVVRKVNRGQIVEVVRYRECKHYATSDFDGDILCGCTIHSAMLDITPDSFCSYGDRNGGAD